MRFTISRRQFIGSSAVATALGAVPHVHAAGSDVLRSRPDRLRRPGHRGRLAGAQGRPGRQARRDGRRVRGPPRAEPGHPHEGQGDRGQDRRAAGAPLRRLRCLQAGHRQRSTSSCSARRRTSGRSTSKPRSRPASTSSPRSRSPSMLPASAPFWQPAKQAKAKGLSIVSGLCLRYDEGLRETVRRIHDGAIGDVLVLQANDYRAADLGQAASEPTGATWSGRCATGTTSPGCRATSTSSSTFTCSTPARG